MVRNKIEQYLNLILSKRSDEFINISKKMKNDTDKNRLIDDIHTALIEQQNRTGKTKIDAIVNEIEISLYE